VGGVVWCRVESPEEEMRDKREKERDSSKQSEKVNKRIKVREIGRHYSIARHEQFKMLRN
jgi:hypothetical protein